MLQPSMNPSYGSQTVTQNWVEKKEEDEERLAQLSLTSSLEESHLLYQSCIDQEAIELNQSAQASQTQGNTLITQLENLVATAEALNEILAFVKRENTNLVTVGMTLGTGITALWNGSLFSGLALTGAALNEIVKMRRAPVGEAKTLAEEIKTGLLMIQQLEEYQKSSLQTIGQQIDLVKDQIDGIELEFKEIESLAVQGSRDAELKKQEALKMRQEAAYAYRQAFQTLQQSQSDIVNVIGNLKNIIKEFSTLIEQANSGALEPKDIERFIGQAKKILKVMVEAQAKLIHAQDRFNTGLKELQHASELNKNALAKQTEAILTMQHYLKEIQLKANMENKIQETKKQLSEAKDEVGVAEKRADRAQKIAELKAKQAEKLEEQLGDQWGQTSTLVGATATMAAVALGGGPLSVPMGFGVAGVTHYSRKIYSFAKNYFGKLTPEIDAAKAPKKLANYTVVYNSTSTGWGNYSIGLVSQIMGGAAKGSKTAGVIAINLGDDKPQVYHFNKNSPSPQGKMNEGDMKKLIDDLRKKIQEGKLDYEGCLMLINSLANVQTEHGDVCLVAPDAIFFEDLRDECRRNLSKG